MHELMHGLGPHDITVGGRATTVRQELKDTYSAIEEAKADISGLFALQFLVDRGQLDKAFERTMYTTFLASAFRSIRFGINEAHGRGQAIQLNYLLDQGGFTVSSDGTFAVNAAKIREGVTSLTREIMTLQAEGSYDKAKADDRLARNRAAGNKDRDRSLDQRAGRHRAAFHDRDGAAQGRQVARMPRRCGDMARQAARLAATTKNIDDLAPSCHRPSGIPLAHFGVLRGVLFLSRLCGDRPVILRDASQF